MRYSGAKTQGRPTMAGSGSFAAAGLGGDLVIDELPRRVFTLTAAAGNGQVDLDFTQRRGTAIHYLADLAVADGMTNTHVHTLRPAGSRTLNLSMSHSKSKCE